MKKKISMPSEKSYFIIRQVSLKENTQHLEVAKFSSELSESTTEKTVEWKTQDKVWGYDDVNIYKSNTGLRMLLSEGGWWNVKLAINKWPWVNEDMCASQLNDLDKISWVGN